MTRKQIHTSDHVIDEIFFQLADNSLIIAFSKLQTNYLSNSQYIITTSATTIITIQKMTLFQEDNMHQPFVLTQCRGYPGNYFSVPRMR